MRLWIVAAVFLAMAIAQAAESVDATFDRLAKADVFAFGPTGYAGIISRGEKDYRVILSRPSAMADLRTVPRDSRETMHPLCVVTSSFDSRIELESSLKRLGLITRMPSNS